MHHSDFIGIIASNVRPKIYVELGLYTGETLGKVLPYAGKCYGVDIKQNDSLDILKLNYGDKLDINYCMTDDFFKTFKDGIDMAFIDADHCCESALKDFENCFKLLNDGGVILMHDTDPECDSLIDPGYCGDSYKIVSILEKRDDLNIVTLPITNAGLSIITKKANTRTFLRGLKN
jgi:predicted O-methyltransferase YrrM